MNDTQLFDDQSSYGSPSTAPGFDPATGAVRIIPYARKVWSQQFFRGMLVPANNTTVVTSSENYNVSNYSKVRLFAKASGLGNVDLVIRLSLNGGFDYVDAHTFPMGEGVKTVMTPLMDIGALNLKVGLYNKASGQQSVDVWGFFILSVTRWQYRDTKDLLCMHVASTNNTTTVPTDSQQIEYRFQNSTGAEFKWHRPAGAGSELTGKAVFPPEITTQDPKKMSQLKIYLNYSPKNADRDGVTHVICDMKSSREIKGLELICGFLIQMNENGDPGYGNNQDLAWDVYREPITLIAGTQRLIRQIPGDHIRKQADAQAFMPRLSPFYYWRLQGDNTFLPGDVLEFSFRFVSQPFANAPVGVRASASS